MSNHRFIAIALHTAIAHACLERWPGPFHRIISIVAIALPIAVVLLWTPGVALGQDLDGTLETATNIECAFSLMSLGAWGDAAAEAELQEADLVLEFQNVNADEASAELASGFGIYDIVVRYAPGYLHFIQSFRDGPLYVTTVLENEAPAGGLMAMHSRHEHTDFALPGFTSSPEQYYGECRVLDQGTPN